MCGILSDMRRTSTVLQQAVSVFLEFNTLDYLVIEHDSVGT